MNKKFRLISSVFISALSINSALALPIDWSGVFGVDTHMLSNTCRTKNTPPAEPNPREGSQGINDNECSASFQTYIFKLNPSIIVNDGVTLKGELSSGNIRGGFLGGEASNSADGGPHGSYFFTTPAQRSALNVNQMYMELYADTALVKIGRMNRGYGMGMIFSDGKNPWDRFFTMYDGIEAEMKIGNFSIVPYFAKISNFSDADESQASGALNVKEIGLIAKYDNKNRDLVASVLYAKRDSKNNNGFYHSSEADPTKEHPRGKTDVTVIEPYVSKKWNKLTLSAEASYQTGKMGQIYAPGENTRLDSLAYVFDLRYDLNPKWEVGILAGEASGDKGNSSKFGATYLNPNFQIADLMFRYNYAAISEGGRSVFDSSVVNARFFKLFGNYKTDKWTWKSALIFANALETAKTGKKSYHHERNYRYDAKANQNDSYGYELDLGFDYRWNPNVTISGYYAYWMVGDYYEFVGDGSKLSLSNVHGGGLRATVEF